MHIAIDARMYGTAQRGIGRYLMKLIEHLEVVDTKNHYTIFLRRENFEEYQPRNPNFKKALWDTPWYGWREQITGYRLQVTGIDLVHFPHWNVPLLFRRPFVVTIHDLELFSSNRTRNASTRGRIMYWLKWQIFQIVFRHAVLASRAIIVPSHYVEEQLLDLYPQTRKKVQVIYEAPTIQVSALKPETCNLKPQRYALYVGAAYPHKNLPRLLKAWQMARQELPDHQLVLVGREDWFWQRLKMRNAECGMRNIVFYGPATDHELSALYQNAALLVQPSLEEGFSLSPLEALAHGTPVTVSDIPVHHEILQTAAVFFDPYNIEAISTTLVQALRNPETRAAILQRAPTLLTHYSWKNHAQETLRLYKTAGPV